MPECLFCDIAAEKVPAALVPATGRVLAFCHIDPQAPTHVPGGRSLTWPPG